MADFHALSRYASEDIKTEAKRKAKFLNRLSDELKIPLTVAYAPNYQILLDQAIILEDNIKKAENRKRKLNVHKHHSETSFKRPFPQDTNQGHKPGHYPSGGSNHKHHGHNHSGGFKGNNGNHKGNGNAGHNNGQHRPNPEYKKDISQVLCFKCNNKGHYATDCPEKKAAEAAKPNPFQKGHHSPRKTTHTSF